MEKRPRNSVKAIIIESGKVLLNKCRQSDGDIEFYVFPGGGQRQGETLHEALIRECKEELGTAVEPSELLFVREYMSGFYPIIPKNVHISNPHQVEFYFTARLLSPINLEEAEMDDVQIGVEWILLEELKDIELYPKAIKQYVTDSGIKAPTYIGAVG